MGCEHSCPPPQITCSFLIYSNWYSAKKKNTQLRHSLMVHLFNPGSLPACNLDLRSNFESFIFNVNFALNWSPMLPVKIYSLFCRSLDSSTFLFGAETCGFCLKKRHGTVHGILEHEGKKVYLRSRPYRIFHPHHQFELFSPAWKVLYTVANLIHSEQQLKKQYKIATVQVNISER